MQNPFNISPDIHNYCLVTVAYWGFTLTDGALRMLVLFHFYTLGYTPFTIALLFLLYEFFGIVTNGAGGWIGARRGLRFTLVSGLFLQVFSLTALSFFNPSWPTITGVMYVMGAQALSGIAKDLTKMSSKSALKVLVPNGENGTLFKWVTLLTGSKNTLKGVGFFLGSALLSGWGFSSSLIFMAIALSAVTYAVMVALTHDITQARDQTSAHIKFTDILSKNMAVNYLSAARFFLFGSRDLWFVVGLPLFLTAQLNWPPEIVGSYMALWVIGYGVVQTMAPFILRRMGTVPNGKVSRYILLCLVSITMFIAGTIAIDTAPGISVIIGLSGFGFVFALQSAVHSYLILAYSQQQHVSLDVGFYYMANAGGRLTGTLLSGWMYQEGGLVLCLLFSALFLIASWAISAKLP